MGAFCRISTAAFVGLLIAVAGVVVYFLFPTFVEKQVKEKLNLELEEGLAYENWKKISVPLKIRFYFFNVTNPDEIIENFDKPVLKEIGPYTYRETREKVNVTFDEEGNTVSYRQIRRYYFEVENSFGDENDVVITPNIPIIALVKQAKKDFPNMLSMLKFTLSVKKPPLFKKSSVKELLFDGYRDEIIAAAQKAIKEEFLPNATFGFFYGKNDTDDGNYTVKTGRNDAYEYTKIVSWNGMEKLSMWPNGSHCADINGTDGAQNPPFVKRTTVLQNFVSEMCRSAFLVYEKDVVHRGILTYRFTSDPTLMADPSVNPDNACFCEPGDCMFTGLITMDKCQKAAPVFLSMPHFYQSDPLLLRAVEGLKPDAEKHQINLDVEPTTGTVLNVRRVSQVNVDMEPLYPTYKGFVFDKMPRIVFPVMWFSEGATVDEETARIFEAMAITPVKIGHGVIYAVIAFGGFVILVAFICCIRVKRKENEPKYLPPTTSNSGLTKF